MSAPIRLADAVFTRLRALGEPLGYFLLQARGDVACSGSTDVKPHKRQCAHCNHASAPAARECERCGREFEADTETEQSEQGEKQHENVR